MSQELDQKILHFLSELNTASNSNNNATYVLVCFLIILLILFLNLGPISSGTFFEVHVRHYSFLLGSQIFCISSRSLFIMLAPLQTNCNHGLYLTVGAKNLSEWINQSRQSIAGRSIKALRFKTTDSKSIGHLTLRLTSVMINKVKKDWEEKWIFSQ